MTKDTPLLIHDDTPGHGDSSAAIAERPKSGEVLPAVVDESSTMLNMIERIAANPNVDVVKLEKVIDLQERLLAQQALAAFEADFARMQPDLPEIDERGKIRNRDGSVRSTYATLEDINEVIKPILARHGFSIRHKTVFPADKPNIIRVVGILGHKLGHREQSEFEAPADSSEYRTDIQSQGSTVSYGRRYTTCDLCNITTRGQDNDGQGGKPQPPQGYDAWFGALDGVVVEGPNRLQQVFSDSPVDFKNYTVKYRAAEWNALKAKAQQHAAANRRPSAPADTAKKGQR